MTFISECNLFQQMITGFLNTDLYAQIGINFEVAFRTDLNVYTQTYATDHL